MLSSRTKPEDARANRGCASSREAPAGVAPAGGSEAAISLSFSLPLGRHQAVAWGTQAGFGARCNKSGETLQYLPILAVALT
jgi:hypothetical protein